MDHRPPRSAPRPPRARGSRLVEGAVCRAAARAGAAVFLALDDAAVARQEAALLHGAAQIRLVLGKRLGDAVAHRAGLARQTAARDGGDHVELLAALRDVERLLDDHLLRGPCE